MVAYGIWFVVICLTRDGHNLTVYVLRHYSVWYNVTYQVINGEKLLTCIDKNFHKVHALNQVAAIQH